MGHSGSEFRRRGRLELVPDGARALTNAQRDILRKEAARAQFSRQLRHKLFGPAMFVETAWDILLILYISDGELPAPDVSELARSTGSPFSTAVRWLDYLEEEGLAIEIADGVSGGASWVELTRKGRSLLDDYFLELCKAESSA